jgi:DHA3 family macrolide efflux protein-like MFS transporter
MEPPPDSKFTPLFANHNFRLLFASDALSGFGDRLTVFALFLLIYNMTGRALDLGLLMIIQVLPAILIGPLAGVYVDRVSKKRILVSTNCIQGVIVFLIPFTQVIWQVYLIAGIQAVARQLFNPARLAVLPEIVGQEQLPRANAVNSVLLNVLLIAGPATGGVIVGFFGTGPAFFVDAATFIIGAGLLLGLKSAPQVSRPGGEVHFIKELREGFGYMIHNPLMRRLVPFLALLVLIGSMQSPLVVVFVKSVLMKGDVELGWLMSALGVGGILGGLVTAGLGPRLNRPTIISWLFVGEGLLLIMFALNRVYPLSVAIFLLFGTLGSALQIVLMSLFQTHIPEDKRGRVFANLTPILGPLSIVSIGLGTFLADAVGVALVLLISGGLEFAGGVYGAIRKLTAIPPPSNGIATGRTPPGTTSSES